MKILVTGVTGMVGQAVVARLASDSRHMVRAAIRHLSADFSPGFEVVPVGDLGARPDCTAAALKGMNVVIHLAARVHVMDDTAADPLAEFRRVNVQGTLNLARQAAAAGVRRFVFISSIKVNGEATTVGAPFSADDIPARLIRTAFPRWRQNKGCGNWL